ncbi:MAG: GNAT family N-acetyltransferase [Sporichthyaceae bacterium]|nr:GNAT family N-acetyltransferase [Sporichthyaceae bacterium]
MSPTIEPLDPTTAGDAELAATYALRLACHNEAAPDEPMVAYPDWLALNRISPPHVRRWHWRSEYGYAQLVQIVDAPGGIVEVCVAAPVRRRGLGRALLDRVRAQARAAGCETLMGWFGLPAGAEFTRAVGGRIGNSRHVQVLAMPGRLGRSTVPADYRLRSWVGAAPEDLVDSYATALNAINDAPSTAGEPEYEWTPALVGSRRPQSPGAGSSCGSRLRSTAPARWLGSAACGCRPNPARSAGPRTPRWSPRTAARDWLPRSSPRRCGCSWPTGRTWRR